MFDRQVLAALAVGIAADRDDDARAAVARLDPVLRGLVRRKLERALVDAALACDAAKLTTPSDAHVMRVAALAVTKRAASAGDPIAVAAAYEQLPRVAMPRFPLWSLVTLTGAVALLGLATYLIATRPGAPSRTYTREMPAPSADAFRVGGVPLRTAAIDRLLGEPLTKLVVAGGRARDGRANDLTAMLAKHRDASAIRTRGEPLASAWTAAIDVFAASVAAASQPEGPTSRQFDELRESVREVSDAFAAAGLGYVLEGRFKAGYPYIQAYRVEEVKFVVTAGAPRRVLSLRRLDRLNTAYSALGMHDEDVGDPVLHLDRLDEHVASTVLPVLATDAPYLIAEHDWIVTDRGKALAAKIGHVVRGEYASALGADASAAGMIAPLLVKRNEIVDEWRDHLLKKQIYFVRTENLFLPANLIDQLEDVTPKYQRNRVVKLETQLAELEAPRIHARVHDLVAASVRRHEAQHGHDYDRDAELAYPAELASMLGPPHDGEGNAVPIVRSARAELSAYLSSIANDPMTPQATLWHLGRQAFTRERWGTGECYAAIVVLEGLARQLGATVDGRAFRGGVDRERLVGFATLIASQPPDKLRAAASSLWTELYAEPLTTIVDRAPAAAAAR